MIWGQVFSRDRSRPQPPPSTNEVRRSAEQVEGFKDRGRVEGVKEMVKILQPGHRFEGIPNVPEDAGQRRAFLSGFWDGMQKKIRELAQDGEEGVFAGNLVEWDSVDTLIGQRLTQAEFSRAQGNLSERIDMTDVQTLINSLLEDIPPDAMRPTN